MPNLAELIADPELMRREAAHFASLCQEPPTQSEDMNQGIENEDQIMEIFHGIAQNRSVDYKTYCAIGREDF